MGHFAALFQPRISPLPGAMMESALNKARGACMGQPPSLPKCLGVRTVGQTKTPPAPVDRALAAIEIAANWRKGCHGAHGADDQRMSSTGVLQLASTLVLTEPMTSLLKGLWPRAPMTMRSNWPCSAYLAISSPALPMAATVAGVAPC